MFAPVSAELNSPSTDVLSLTSVTTMLARWAGEADAARLAALATRTGNQPASSTVVAAEQAQGDIMELLVGIDLVLDTLLPGNAEFSAWLRAQVTALALLESFGNSLDLLDRSTAVPSVAAVQIAHEAVAPIAAE